MSSQTGEWAHSLTFCAKDSAHRRRHQSDGEDNVYQGSSVRRPRACSARVLRRPEVGEAASTRETFRKNELHTPRMHEHVHEKAGKKCSPADWTGCLRAVGMDLFLIVSPRFNVNQSSHTDWPQESCKRGQQGALSAARLSLSRYGRLPEGTGRLLRKAGIESGRIKEQMWYICVNSLVFLSLDNSAKSE